MFARNAWAVPRPMHCLIHTYTYIWKSDASRTTRLARSTRQLLWDWLWYLLLAVLCNSVFYLSYSCVDLPARLPATVISGRDGCNPDDLTDYIESIKYQYLEIPRDILHRLGQ